MTDRVGAYGLCLPTLPGRRWLQPVPPSWPTWSHELVTQVGGDESFHANESRVRLPLVDHTSVELDRHDRHIRYHSRSVPPTAAWVHPILSPPAMFAADWQGRLVFHAGAFVDGQGRSWIVFGEREDGKSTALAWLAMNGVAVLTDDLVVTDGRTVLVGPRCVDLRSGAAAHLQLGESVATLGGRERLRVTLEPAPAETPLAGFIQLGWHDDGAARIDSVSSVAGRVAAITAARALLTSQKHPAAWLAALALPVFRFGRRRDWRDLDSAMNCLVRFSDRHAG